MMQEFRGALAEFTVLSISK